MLRFRTLPARLAAAYLRNSRWELARWRLQEYSLARVRKFGGQLGTATVATHIGCRMELDPADWVDQHIYATGSYEESTVATIAALLKPGDACVDIGANIGFFTLLMSRLVGPSGTVVAFEPAPDTRERLLRNLALNGVHNVVVRDEAVSREEGMVRFFTAGRPNSGTAGLRRTDPDCPSIEVKARRLADCLPDSTHPRLVKIDIEGAEHLALAGMAGLLERRHPDLVVEMSDHFLRNMGSSSAEVFEFLRRFGYRMWHIDWNGLVEHDRLEPSLPVQFNALYSVRTTLPARLLKPVTGR